MATSSLYLGYLATMQHLGLLRKMDGPRHANKRYECIKWLVGKRDEYEIIRSTEIVQTCLEVSRRYPVLQCPGLTSWEDVENRMQQYKEMLEKYPGEMMCGKQSKYVKPHVLRKFFWALEEHFKIPIPNHIHMGDMEMMFPDFKEHMKKLHKSLTAGECQMALGVPCSQASMWACLCEEALGLKVVQDNWNPVALDHQGRSSQQEDAIKSKKQVEKLAELAEKYRAEHDGKACSPKVLFQLFDWKI